MFSYKYDKKKQKMYGMIYTAHEKMRKNIINQLQ